MQKSNLFLQKHFKQMENNIAVVIQEEGKSPRVSIHPERSLPHFQRIWGNFLIDYYLVDENGERVRTTSKPVVAITREERGFEALKKIAKELKIKKWHLMSGPTLLKAVQEANKNK